MVEKRKVASEVKEATQDSVSVGISRYMARRVEIQKEVSKHNEAIRVLTEEFFRLEGGILALQELLNKEIVKSKEDK